MIVVEEIMPLTWPMRERQVPADVRQRQLDERNDLNLLRWHRLTFGPVVGTVLHLGPQAPGADREYHNRLARLRHAGAL